MRLEGSDLACIRGGREVFAGLHFSVGGGEALLVTGRNGAGKSTLLRVVAGLVRLTGGRLTLSDGDADSTVAEHAHYLGHLDALKPSLTVGENLRFWAQYLGASKPAADSIDAALAAVGLGTLADLPSAYLSAGQRRRLSIARILAVKRPIWLLDEPTAALDREAQDKLVDLMRRHLAGGGIIAAATHGPIGLDGARELRLGASP